nr:immunoglobulin heavy chain junction region [Macaca mulatta]MOX95229.1 immunoglobulin heavy chain junction region [Macaca mulatta]
CARIVAGDNYQGLDSW